MAAREPAESGLSAGFLAIQARIRAFTYFGMVFLSGGGVSLMCAMAIATCDSPVKGLLPTRHSYATIPRE